MATRAQIVECARTYLGTPFKHQGRIRGLGLDCVGLPICVARDLGLPVRNYANYGRQPSDDTVLRECRKSLVEVPEAAMALGDVLCLRIPQPCHTAIVTEVGGKVGIIHAYSVNQKVVEHILDFKWRRRIAGVFRFPGVED